MILQEILSFFSGTCWKLGGTCKTDKFQIEHECAVSTEGIKQGQRGSWDTGTDLDLWPIEKFYVQKWGCEGKFCMQFW